MTGNRIVQVAVVSKPVQQKLTLSMCFLMPTLITHEVAHFVLTRRYGQPWNIVICELLDTQLLATCDSVLKAKQTTVSVFLIKRLVDYLCCSDPVRLSHFLTVVCHFKDTKYISTTSKTAQLLSWPCNSVTCPREQKNALLFDKLSELVRDLSIRMTNHFPWKMYSRLLQDQLDSNYFTENCTLIFSKSIELLVLLQTSLFFGNGVFQ